MKKIVYLLISLVIVTSCEDNVIGDFDGAEIEQNFSTDDLVNKRGVAFTNSALAWSYKTSEQKAHWMYSWGNVLRDEVPENVDFVPMFWGRGSVNTDNLDRIRGLIEEGKVKYVLGFNEPDGAEQSNMTVDEAIELWPQLETLGVPLGSPATVNPNNEWMTEFMQRAEELNLRVDFVAIHHYGGNNPINLLNKLKQTYDDYNQRPIWITEFAVADWNATSPQNNRYTDAEVIGFMNEVLPILDEIDWVHRYAWFSGTQAPLYSSALYDDNASLTAVGQVYANHNPNATIGPGQDTPFDDPSIIELIDHEDANIDDAGGTQGYQLAGGNSSIQQGTGSGNNTNVLKALHGNNNDLFVRTRQVHVEEGDIYVFKFDIALTNAVHTVRLFIETDNGTEAISPDSATTTNGTADTNNIGKITGGTPNQFGTTTTTFTIPSGNYNYNSARFQIYQWGTSNSFELDNLSVLKAD